MYVHIQTHICTFALLATNARTHTHACVCMHTHTHTHTHNHTHTCTHTCIHTYIHVRTYTRIHTSEHTVCMHTHTYNTYTHNYVTRSRKIVPNHTSRRWHFSPPIESCNNILSSRAPTTAKGSSVCFSWGWFFGHVRRARVPSWLQMALVAVHKQTLGCKPTQDC